MASQEYEPLVDLKNAKEIAAEIFSMYDQNNTGFIGEHGVKDMMRDAYQTINKSFEPSQGDVKSYFEVLDCQNEGQVNYKDLEKHVIRFLIGEDYDVQVQQRNVSEVAQDVFRQFDAGKEGRIRVVQLKQMITSVCAECGVQNDPQQMEMNNYVQQVDGQYMGSFGELTFLEHLRLDRNQLRALPDNFGDLVALQWLELQHNELAQLPDSFPRLTKLQRLKIEDNRLTELPTDFGKLESLEAMAAESNRIAALPDSFAELLSLQHLGLELNCISHLPENFGELESLETLYLGGNRILSLPSSFNMLKSLKTCSLGPLNRFRFSWPRTSFILGLGRLQVEAASCTEQSEMSDGAGSDERGPTPEVLGNSSDGGDAD